MQSNADTWELSKENIQPLRSGRKVSCLKMAFQPTPKDLETLNNERQKFEEEILAGENEDDPIDAWDRYLQWILQNYPKGQESDHYIDLMQKYVVKFLKYEKYQNDPRYVKVWINMTIIDSNPNNSFRYMVSKDIGTKCACFYIAWAEEHEKYGRWKKANDVYEKGVSNKAQPTDLLMKHKNAFEMRSARAAMLDIQQTDQQGTSEQSQRTGLGVLEGRGKVKAVGTIRNTNNNKVQPLKQPLNMKPSQNKAVHIFNENEAPSKNPSEIVGTWSGMPNQKCTDKENDVMDPSVWRGSKVKQSSRKTALAPKITPMNKPATFSIFQDELPENNSDVNAAMPPSARKLASTVEKLLTERKPRKEKKYLSHQEIAEEYGEITNDPNIVRHYPVEKVYSVMGEFSLEEIWAASWRKKQKEDEQKKEEKKKVKSMWEGRVEDGGIVEDEEDSEEQDPKARGISSLQNEDELAAPDLPILSDNVPDEYDPLPVFTDQENSTESTISDERKRELVSQPSPTINTKFARVEIEEMFKQEFQDIHPPTLKTFNSNLTENQPFSIFCDVPVTKKGGFNIFSDDQPLTVESKPCKVFSLSCSESQRSENSENIPTPGYTSGIKRTNLAGILQPAVGFELKTPSSSEEEDFEEIELAAPDLPILSDNVPDKYNPLPVFTNQENITESTISDERKNDFGYHSLNQSKLSQPSPTLYTKFAREAIEEMFKQEFEDIETPTLTFNSNHTGNQPFSIFCDVPATKKGGFNIFSDDQPLTVESKPCKVFSLPCEENQRSENSENITKRANLGLEVNTPSSSEKERYFEGVGDFFHDGVVYSQPLNDYGCSVDSKKTDGNSNFTTSK